MILRENRFQNQTYIDLSKSIFLDGVDDYLKIPDWCYGYLNGTHDWSISLMVKLNGNQPANRYLYSSLTSGTGLEIYFTGTTNRLTFKKSDGTIVTVDTLIDLPDNIWTLVTITYDQTNLRVYINSQLRYEGGLVISDMSVANISDFYIGANSLGANRVSAYFAYFRKYSKALDVGEIIYEYQNTGLIKTTAASRCVFELSNQDDIFEADATFVANHPEFTIGDYVALDVVQKYNHLKPFSTTTISSFSDNGSSGTTVTTDTTSIQNGDIVYINSAVSSILNSGHKAFNRTGASFDIPVIYPNNPADNGVARWGLAIEEPSHGFVYGKLPSELGLINRSSSTDIKDFYNSDTIIKNGALLFTNLTQYLSFGSTTSWDNIVYEGTAVLSLNIGSSRIDVSTLGTVSYLEIRDISNNVLSSFNFREVESTIVIDLTGSNDATLVNWTVDETLIGGGTWLDKHSLVPKPTQYVSTQNTLNFRNLAITGLVSPPEYFTISITFKEQAIVPTNNFRLFEVMTAANSPLLEWYQNSNTQFRVLANRLSKRDYIYNNVQFSGADVGSPKAMRFDEFNTISVTYKRKGTNLYRSESVYINGHKTVLSATLADGDASIDFATIAKLSINSLYTGSLTGKFDIIQFGIFSREVTYKEIAEINLVDLPSKALLESAMMYYQFQSGSIFDDGVASNPVIRDLSGNDYDLEVFGLTGATKADKITDFRTNFVEKINENL